jgi:hypothetical protein
VTNPTERALREVVPLEREETMMRNAREYGAALLDRADDAPAPGRTTSRLAWHTQPVGMVLQTLEVVKWMERRAWFGELA